MNNAEKEQTDIFVNHKAYLTEIGPLRASALNSGLTQITPEFVCNYLLSRASVAQHLLGHEDSKRDVDRECNYPTEPDAHFYHRLYCRGDIAQRVNDMWPDLTWEDTPQILELNQSTTAPATPFEAAYQAIEKKHALFSKYMMVDKVSGIGHYGCLFYGLPGSPDMPAPGWDNHTRMWGNKFPSNTPLAYVRAYGEAQCSILSYEMDPSHPRYGLPTTYEVNIADYTQQQKSDSKATPPPQSTIMVHCSRIQHICEDFLGSETHAAPRAEGVLNRLLDIRKVAGGSGEMFWKGGFPGISFEVDPKNTEVELDKEALRNEMQAFTDGLQRYLALVGVKANSLKVQVADPTPHVDMNLKLIAIAKNVPYRIFSGTEEGKLAGGQDQKNIERRTGKRREHYATAKIVRPSVEILVRTGVIPPPTNKSTGKTKENTYTPTAVATSVETGLTAQNPANKQTPIGTVTTTRVGSTGDVQTAQAAYGPDYTYGPNEPGAEVRGSGVKAAEQADGAKRGTEQTRALTEQGKQSSQGTATIGAERAERPTSSTDLEFSVLWPPAGRPSPDEAATILLKVATALEYYSKGNASLIMPPLAFLVDIVGLTQERAMEILEDVKANLNERTASDSAMVAAQLARIAAADEALKASSSPDSESASSAKKS